MSRSRISGREERKTARALEKSLESTHQGLATLLESLERSGFKDAVYAYQQMQLVLIQQQLWCRTYRRDELNALWRKIAEAAGAIHAILAPFSAVMDVLKNIERIEAANGAAAARSAASLPHEEMAPEDTAINEFVDLFLQGLSISDFKLSRCLSWPDDVRKLRLRELTATGVLERRGWGRGQSYRLAPVSRKRLVAELVKMLQIS